MTAFNNLVERALTLSTQAHNGQCRKTGKFVPYVIHPMHMALIASRWGQMNPFVIITCLMHDVVEDCPGWSLGRMATEFGGHGPQIAGYVAELTEDKSLSWEERKAECVHRVPFMTDVALHAKAADCMHNMSSLIEALTNGEDVWRHFKRGPAVTIHHYRELTDALCQRVGVNVAEDLQATVGALERYV
jgi:GTP pyrophosphokinase